MPLPFPKYKKEETAAVPLSAEEIYEKGVATLKDLIAPAGLEITPGFLKLAGKLAKTIFIFSYPRTLVAGWFFPVVNLDETLDISIFYHPLDTAQVLHNLRKKAAHLGAEISEAEEKGMVRDPVLETALQDVEGLRDALQQGRDKLFRVACYITFLADTEEDLQKIESRIVTLLEQKLVYTKSALFQQFAAYESTMPLGTDRVEARTALNVGPSSTFFPFISVDLTSEEGILYGINMHNNSLIIFDRFQMENANMAILATSGAGKSYFEKLEIIRSLMLGADVIVLDPENEYKHLSEAMGGSFFRISLASEDHINPFEIPVIREDETPQEAFREHVLGLIGLMKVMVGTLSPQEEAILDRAIVDTYASRDITPERILPGQEPPRMEDLERVLASMEGGEDLAAKLYKYTKGTFASFTNQPTTVDLANRLIVFSIRDLEDELRPIAMYIILHYIWNIIRKELKRRIVVIDEAWWLMQHPDGAAFLFGLVKRARKYYLGVTTITQDIDDFLRSPYGKPIITNSSLQMLLKQSPAAISLLGEAFELTSVEKQVLTTAGVGEGIFFAGLKHVMIKVIPSYTEDQIITSDPKQILAIKKAQMEMGL